MSAANPTFGLVRTPGILGRLIRIGQRLRVPAEYAWCNHAFILVEQVIGTNDYYIIEAAAKGPRWARLSDYRPGTYQLVTVPMSQEDANEVVDYARSTIGDQYGFITIACIAFNLLTPSFFRIDFRRKGTLICSALVARALEHGGVIGPDDPFQVMPAQLAVRYGVKAPPQGRLS